MGSFQKALVNVAVSIFRGNTRCDIRALLAAQAFVEILAALLVTLTVAQILLQVIGPAGHRSQ